MNPTLYQQLSPLGFAEWLEKMTNEYWILPEIAEGVDDTEIDDWQRTTLNALAFRWLREDKDLICFPIPMNITNSFGVIILQKNKRNLTELINTVDSYDFQTHELAEHEALNKALEILSKGGENGMD